jgi:hypothetical protein
MTESRNSRDGRRGLRRGGAYIYEDYKDNHVIWRGREDELKKFLAQPYGNLQHKLKNAYSSNSEDALTWSCFDTLRQVNALSRARALSEIWELAFGPRTIPDGVKAGDIHIGNTYGDAERTEVDLSIERSWCSSLFRGQALFANEPSRPPKQTPRSDRPKAAGGCS